MSTRDVYRALSLWNLAKTATRGPGALTRALIRRQNHKTLARLHRKVGL